MSSEPLPLAGGCPGHRGAPPLAGFTHATYPRSPVSRGLHGFCRFCLREPPDRPNDNLPGHQTATRSYAHVDQSTRRNSPQASNTCRDDGNLLTHLDADRVTVEPFCSPAPA